ncbi:acyl-CoA dehydrogenase family protein [Actinomycetospora aeridis]|uniref:Acyl-CoA dehydrogenase n=1 Tax=Actinomycetospora aeridis TaxID=3129231 RepID=A0ABU8N9B7_9PSEU
MATLLADDLERRLGPPDDEALRRRDEQGTVTALAAAAGPDLRLSFVPAAAGGTLASLEETLALARAAARRDATVMPATMFGITATTAVLIGGTAAQRAEVVDLAGAGRTVAFAVSERDHDADPLAGTCALVDTPDGPVLRGRKWRVGTGPHTTAALVLARTGGRGPAAFSLVVVRDPALRAARVADRGADGWRGVAFADLAFDDVAVSPDDVVGGPDGVGRGIELMLRAMQVVRVTSTAAGLGAMDLALRVAREDGAAGPVATAELEAAAVAATAAEVHARVAARALHTAPGQQALGSSAVKWVVTELTDEVFDRAADVLGFSAVLAGPFAIARRDAALARYVDTDPHANLDLLAAALRRLALRPTGPRNPGEELAAAVTFGAALPAFDPAGTALAGRDEMLLDGLPALVDALRAGGGDPELLARAEATDADVRALLAAIAVPGLAPPQLATLAARGAFLHAAAACVHVAASGSHEPRARLLAATDLLRARAAGTRRTPDASHDRTHPEVTR